MNLNVTKLVRGQLTDRATYVHLKSCTPCITSPSVLQAASLLVIADQTATLSGNISIKLVSCDAYGGLPKANCANWQEPIL